jgi:5-methylcytosine-specific restriction protein A
MPNAVPSHRPSWIGPTTRHQRYDRDSRDGDLKFFYNSGAWRKARALKLGDDPLCERCAEAGRLTAASHVHHRIEVRDDRSLALEQGNLESLCHPCHSRHHASGQAP